MKVILQRLGLGDIYLQKFFLLIIAIVISGVIIHPILAAGLCVLSFFQLARIKKGIGCLLLCLAVLALSDSRSNIFAFASLVKPALIVLLFFFSTKLKTNNPIFKYYIPFVVIVIVCMFRNINLLVSFQKSLSYILLLYSVPTIFTFFLREKKCEIYVKYILAIPLIILASGLLFKYINPELTSLLGRYRGLLGNPNGLGIFISIYFLFFRVIKMKFPNIYTKSEIIVIYFLFFSSLIFSGSRTSLILILMFYVLEYVFRYRLDVAIVFSVFLTVGLQFAMSNAIDVIVMLNMEEYFRLDTIEEGSGRVIAWEFAWNKIQDNYFLGNGISFTEGLFKENYQKLSMMGHQGNAHNSYLTTWLDTGLLGLLAYFIPTIFLFFRGMAKTRLALPIMFCVLFSINMESWLSASLNPFTIVFFMILTLISYNEPPEEKEEAIV